VVDCDGFLDLIPTAYTWKLQVMDYGVNKPFKHYARDCCYWWFGIVEYSYKTKPVQEDVAQFNRVTKATIISTWRKVGVPATATFEVCEKVSEDAYSNNNNNNDSNKDLSTTVISELSDSDINNNTQEQ
jgi:hypothetical protein